MKWCLSGRLNQTTVIEAETAYDAVMAHTGPRESDHAATQPDPEIHPEWWQQHFTRSDFDGLPFRYVASFTVRPESSGAGRREPSLPVRSPPESPDKI